MSTIEEEWECPGEAHTMDCNFNPSSQDVYGPGYHDCDICDNELYVTKEVYDEEVAWQAGAKKRAELRRIRLHEEMMQQQTVDKIMSSTQSKVVH